MTYDRVVSRNLLRGDCNDNSLHPRIADDLRRLEQNTLDPLQLAGYAKIGRTTPECVEAIFRAFFFGEPDPESELTEDEHAALYENLPHVKGLREIERKFAELRTGDG